MGIRTSHSGRGTLRLWGLKGSICFSSPVTSPPGTLPGTERPSPHPYPFLLASMEPDCESEHLHAASPPSCPCAASPLDPVYSQGHSDFFLVPAPLAVPIPIISPTLTSYLGLHGEEQNKSKITGGIRASLEDCCSNADFQVHIEIRALALLAIVNI